MSTVSLHGGFRGGYTTGACAAAASKAAVLCMTRKKTISEVSIVLPDGEEVCFPVAFCEIFETGARAGICKDGGDDPDVTTGLVITATVKVHEGNDTTIVAGDGIGVVTLPGLSVPPGDPAINPVPRQMIRNAVCQVTGTPLHITISVPGGREIAQKTYNPHLGIKGGISIIGTTGYVRPYSVPALRESLRLSLDVAIASGVWKPVFVPGNIGRKAAQIHLKSEPHEIVEVSNEWGFMLDAAVTLPITGLCIVGHPGKLAKLAVGEWNTHSSRSSGVLDILNKITGVELNGMITAEGFFAALPEDTKLTIANKVAGAVRSAIAKKCNGLFPIAVLLCNMQSEIIGSSGEYASWKK